MYPNTIVNLTIQRSYRVEISSTITKFNFNVISTLWSLRTMKRLSNIPKKMNQEFQCIGTMHTNIIIIQTLSKDLSIIQNGRDNTTSRSRTITIKRHRTTLRGTNNASTNFSGMGSTYPVHQCNAILRLLGFYVYLPNLQYCQSIHGIPVPLQE